MNDQSLGECPPLRLESRLRFEAVRKGMHIRVVEEEPDFIDSTSFRARRKVVGEGKVLSNTDGVITIEGARGVTTTIEKAKLDRYTRIYEIHPPRPFIYDIDENMHVPMKIS